MKFKWVTCVFLVLVAVAMRLPAQQSDAGRKWFEDTKAKAESGDAIAQCVLAEIYDEGKTVTQNEVEAVKWFRKSAAQGHAEAQNNLGNHYAEGKGVPQDEGEAVSLYTKAAEQNYAVAQNNLGACYERGQGAKQNYELAVKWIRKAAEQGFPPAQYNLGVYYETGHGLETNYVEAMRWYGKAANQGDAIAQYSFAKCYYDGRGVPQDYMEALKWFRKAAEQGYSKAQCMVGFCYEIGQGVTQNYVEAYIWFNLAAAQGIEEALQERDIVASRMPREEITEGQRRAAAFVPHKETASLSSDNSTSPDNPTATGTGFFITDDGYLISSYHVVKDATKVRLITSVGLIDAKVVQVDAANDLALLKADGKFSPLPISSSRSAQLGSTVATVGFPDIGLQGFSPKLAKGEIASLSGASDDPRYFQISVPVQPGNSGGALVDERGNVVGIVSAKLDASAALAASGALPENVNYAVKSSFLLSFLESLPEVDAKLRAPNTKDEKFEDVVKSAQDAAVLVLVY